MMDEAKKRAIIEVGKQMFITEDITQAVLIGFKHGYKYGMEGK